MHCLSSHECSAHCLKQTVEFSNNVTCIMTECEKDEREKNIYLTFYPSKINLFLKSLICSSVCTQLSEASVSKAKNSGVRRMFLTTDLCLKER